ncbi:hypothetical protein [Brucella intermedia]|uniref:hypothetical protein n=1 Tax=Brucella intermedia TaxID=94625 RepID=UPI00224A7FDC|nr:hypothetical protein [Brucella intermedia]
MHFQEHRVGQFQIEAEVIRDHPEIVMKVMAEVIVVRAEHHLINDRVEYDAWSPHFDIVPEGMVAPSYDVVYDADTETVTWAKQED